jgi:hypothetical protein
MIEATRRRFLQWLGLGAAAAVVPEAPAEAAASEWHHIAIARRSTTIQMFVDGHLLDPWANSSSQKLVHTLRNISVPLMLPGDAVTFWAKEDPAGRDGILIDEVHHARN